MDGVRWTHGAKGRKSDNMADYITCISVAAVDVMSLTTIFTGRETLRLTPLQAWLGCSGALRHCAYTKH